MADLEQIPVVKPEEAIAFFEAKGDLPSFAWQDVFQQDHARAFTVAKAMNRDVLQAIRDALEQALRDGVPFDEFAARLRPQLEALGWWGRSTMVDPLDGQAKDVQLGSPARLRTIFRVNMRSAYAAGRWQRIEATKRLLPYLRYVQLQRPTARDTHKPWHGLVVPVDSPWWDQHYPPCDWNCGCTTQQLNARQVAARGWTITEHPPAEPAKIFVNPRTGARVSIEAGIAPGFGFNVGKAYLAALAPHPQPGGGAALAADAGGLAGAAIAFLAAFGLAPDQERVFVDAGGWPVPIGAAWFADLAGRALPAAQLRGIELAAAILLAPSEIRWAWERGDDGRAMLVRRYVGAAAGRAVVVDIGPGGWRVTTSSDSGFDLGALRDGAVSWRAGDPERTAIASVKGGRGKKGRKPAGVRHGHFRPDQKRGGDGRWIDEDRQPPDLKSLLDRALAEPRFRGAHSFGPVSATTVELAGKQSARIEGFQRTLRADEVRHVRKSHFDVGDGRDRDGQPAIGKADFHRIPAIVERASLDGTVAVSGVAGGAKPMRITYRATVEGRAYLYRETIHPTEREVRLQSLHRTEKATSQQDPA